MKSGNERLLARRPPQPPRPHAARPPSPAAETGTRAVPPFVPCAGSPILKNDVRQSFTSLPAPPYFTLARSNGTLKFALREPAGPNPSGGSTISAIVSSPFSPPVGKSMMIVAE